MNTLDLGNADFAALLELAESQFHAWHLKEIRPERERRLSELKKQKLTIGGQAVYAIGIYRELLEREVRQRIVFYAQAAHDSGNREMLSKTRLEEYKGRVMSTVGVSSMALKDRIKRDAHAAGWPESSLPTEHRYVQLQSEILNIVNSELRVLEAAGKLRDPGAHFRSVYSPVAPAASTATEGQLLTPVVPFDNAPDGSVASRARRKRGRPTEIPEERKRRALSVQGGKARAQILYDIKYPTAQHVKNVSAILRHFQRTHRESE